LPTLRFNRFQIVIGEHQLGVRQTRLAFDSELVDEASDLGILDFLYDDIETRVFVLTMIRAGEMG
jgi:hypothetical protein